MMIFTRGIDQLSIQKVVEDGQSIFVGSINGVVVVRAGDGAVTLMLLLFKSRVTGSFIADLDGRNRRRA